MVVRKHPFNQQQASYFAYLRRYKDSEALKGRIRFDDFLRHEHRLVENESFIAGLIATGKTRGGSLPGLIKQQRDLRVLLLIEEDKKTMTADSGNVTDVQGKPTEDDDGMVIV